ncbi:hypothetical protein Q3G72_021510 [Acer saccharum]|nr:hypothetical protein Q3G72_021510 [Acer saccharum]
MAADLKLVYCVLVTCMLVVAAPMADTALSCGLVVISVTPCIGYLRSTEPLPCCNGIRLLTELLLPLLTANRLAGSSDKKCKQWSFWAGKCGVAVSK